MWRSARVLFGTGRIETPNGLRFLIEAVYGPQRDPLPTGLEPAALEAEGAERGDGAQAGFNTIELAGGYGGLGDLPKDQEIGTRLGEDVRILRLARLVDGAVLPWATGHQAWARSEVKVRATWLRDITEPPDMSEALAAARRDWPNWDDALIGVATDEGTLRLEGRTMRLRYDEKHGLMREAVN